MRGRRTGRRRELRRRGRDADMIDAIDKLMLNWCSSYAAEEMVLHQLYDKVLTFINEMIDAA